MLFSQMNPVVLHWWYRRRQARPMRAMWTRPIYLERATESEFVTLYPKLREDPEKFRNYMRMSIDTFDELFSLVERRLTQPEGHWRKPISAIERLIITLRWAYCTKVA
jgi:hypothetical protein